MPQNPWGSLAGSEEDDIEDAYAQERKDVEEAYQNIYKKRPGASAYPTYDEFSQMWGSDGGDSLDRIYPQDIQKEIERIAKARDALFKSQESQYYPSGFKNRVEMGYPRLGDQKKASPVELYGPQEPSSHTSEKYLRFEGDWLKNKKGEWQFKKRNVRWAE